MTRPFIPFFNPSRPVYVKQNDIQMAGKFWKKGERFNWDFFGTPHETIQQLFFNDMLHHNEELEEVAVSRISIGDGLAELSLEQLQALVENINGKVKAKTKDNKEFLQKKCTVSRIKDKQIGLIRKWRISYGELEN
jgi:ribonuclease I